MVLVYDRAPQDPRVARLSDAAFMFWVGAIGICNKWRRDTLAVDELQEELSGRREYDLEACLAELVDAELAHRLPHAHVLLLARLDLWAFDDESEEYVDGRMR